MGEWSGREEERERKRRAGGEEGSKEGMKKGIPRFPRESSISTSSLYWLKAEMTEQIIRKKDFKF